MGKKRGRKRNAEPEKEPEFSVNPFADLKVDAPKAEPEAVRPAPAPEPDRDEAGLLAVFGRGLRRRVVIHIERKGRGGKTVTVVEGFGGDDELARMELLAEIKQKLGVGGIFDDDAMVIQGDQRGRLVAFFEARNVVVAGDRPR